LLDTPLGERKHIYRLIFVEHMKKKGCKDV
jgi:hypothetical protein